jgi:hypothetical protein
MALTNNTGADIGPLNYDATPANYTALGTLLDPTKPDVRDLYIQTFGDQGITGLLDITGAKRSAGTADEVHWYEEGRYNYELKVTYAAASGGKNVFTITKVDGTAPTATQDAATFVRENDVLLLADGERILVVSDVSTTAGTDTFKGVKLGGGTYASANTTEQTAIVIGNAYGQGTAQPSKPFENSLKLRKNGYIISKETFHVNGSQATNIGWLNVNGQNMWYLKGEMDARKKFMNMREAMLVFGKQAAAGSEIATDNGTVSGSEGYFAAIEDRGIVAGGTDSDFATMADLDAIIVQLDKEGAPADYAMYLQRSTSQAIDDLIAQGTSTASNITAGVASQFGAFANGADMVKLGFSSFQRSGYNFHKHDWKLLNDPRQASHAGFRGALIPLGTVVDPKTGGSNPSLEMNYKAAGNYSREMEHWVEGGGVLGYATNGDDVAKFHYRSECNLCVRAANQHVALKSA